MPFRMGAAAMMAAILATLAVMIARAIVDPPVVPDIAGRESFLFQHILLAAVAAGAFQLAFLADGDQPGYATGLRWGSGGFVSAAVAPQLVLSQLPAGAVPLHDVGIFLPWLATVAATGTGIWLLFRNKGPLHGDRRGHLAGLALLAIPFILAPTPDLQSESLDFVSGQGLADSPESGGDAVLMLGLNLLFWLALGLGSVLFARRVVHRP